MRQRGFTVLELIVAVVLLVAIGTVFYVMQRDLEAGKRDSLRKTAINAIYYNLEDIYYPANQGYPEKLTADQLKGLDPVMLKDPSQKDDPNAKLPGEQGSRYRYEPKNCLGGKCKSYSLSADLENEPDYSKTSRNQ